MSKEYLEALGFIKSLLKDDWVDSYWKTYYDTIKQALQRLESIENANPSEALESLEVINNYGCGINDNMKFSEVFEKEYNAIKQALLKAEHDKKLLKIYEQENENQFNNIVDKEKKALAFEIIKEKNVNLEVLGISNNVNCYNKVIAKYSVCYKDLTQEEFELLKEDFFKCIIMEGDAINNE